MRLAFSTNASVRATKPDEPIKGSALLAATSGSSAVQQNAKNNSLLKLRVIL
jgi:hypothetical protein